MDRFDDAELMRMARRLAGKFSSRLWDADDLAHEAYVSMRESPPGRCKSYLHWRAWKRLWRVTRGERLRRSRGPRDAAARPAPACDDLAALVERLLPRREAAIVLAMYWGGESMRELARRTRQSFRRVSQVHARALAWLRQRLPDGLADSYDL